MAIITSVPRGNEEARARPVKGGQKGVSEVFWMILAWVLSLVIAWILGGVSVGDEIRNHPERYGLRKEKTERKEN